MSSYSCEQLGPLSDLYIDMWQLISTAWHSALRKVYILPKFSSAPLRFLGNNTISLRFLIDKSRLCFLHNACNSNS